MEYIEGIYQHCTLYNCSLQAEQLLRRDHTVDLSWPYYASIRYEICYQVGGRAIKVKIADFDALYRLSHHLFRVLLLKLLKITIPDSR